MNRNILGPCLLAAGVLIAVTAHTASADNAGGSGCLDTEGFVVVGELEHVSIEPEGLRLKARIDTGAQTSSLGIVSQQPFERDGQRWLRFSVENPGGEEPVVMERPIRRTAKIKRHGAESMERPVVTFKVTMGDIELEREFTLADRSNYKFPILVGRNLLAGKFLVDVNRKYTTLQVEEREE